LGFAICGIIASKHGLGRTLAYFAQPGKADDFHRALLVRPLSITNGIEITYSQTSRAGGLVNYSMF
jgi:hypothetical protein